MALIKCPECGREISDKVINCIHCGYPLELHTKGDKAHTNEIDAIVREADKHRLNRNYVEALALYEKAAALGNVHSQLWIGNFYERGLGVEIDYTMAHFWFEKASDGGNADAINNLGRLYAKGLGVPQNIVKACLLYKKASDKGCAIASGNLANLYYFGNDVKVDYELAVRYYTLALAQGSREYAVYNNLGVCYMDGKGTRKNYAKAEELLKKAISMGSKLAKDNLVKLHTLSTTEVALNASNNPEPTQPNNTQNSGKNSGGLIIFLVVVLFFLLIVGLSGGNDGDRTCAWCNGTGYSGNGATSVEEYVFNKTPCSHCNGRGNY